MECLVSLAMESVNDREHEKPEPRLANKASAVRINGYQSNKPLDLHARYAPKEEECWCWNPFRLWKNRHATN